MDSPKLRQMYPVDVTLLYGKAKYPKTVTGREYFTVGPNAGILTGVQAGLVTLTGLGKHPVTGINPVWTGTGVLGAFSLVNLASAGGHIAVCANGTVKVRTAAGVESSVAFAANGAEPAVTTVMGVDTDTNGLQAGTIVAGSAYTNTWTVGITRVDATQVNIVLTHTTPATDQVWNAVVDVASVVGDQALMFCGNPAGDLRATPHSAVLGSPIGISVTAQTLTADAILPVVSAFTIPSTGSSYTVTVSSFTVTEAGGSVYRAITSGADAATAPAADSPLWGAVGVTPSTYLIPTANQAGTGAYTLYGWAKDGAGNVSLGVSDAITLTIA
jgi:hypothetical protein